MERVRVTQGDIFGNLKHRIQLIANLFQPNFQNKGLNVKRSSIKVGVLSGSLFYSQRLVDVSWFIATVSRLDAFDIELRSQQA